MSQRLAGKVALITGTADGQGRAREGVSIHEVVGQAQLPAHVSHLVLVEIQQRLDHLLEGRTAIHEIVLVAAIAVAGGVGVVLEGEGRLATLTVSSIEEERAMWDHSIRDTCGGHGELEAMGAGDAVG